MGQKSILSFAFQDLTSVICILSQSDHILPFLIGSLYLDKLETENSYVSSSSKGQQLGKFSKKLGPKSTQKDGKFMGQTS